MSLFLEDFLEPKSTAPILSGVWTPRLGRDLFPHTFRDGEAEKLLVAQGLPTGAGYCAPHLG